jgi:Ca2+-binding RTX toxin-like protein
MTKTLRGDPFWNLPETAAPGSDFVMTLTDADWNDNRRVKDSYSFFLNQLGPYNLTRAGNQLGALANIEFELEGNALDFGTQNIAYTLVETDINSGIFATEIDMDDLTGFGNDGAPLKVDDGDKLKVTYNDFMGDLAVERTDELTIGESGSPGTDFSCMGLTATIVGTEKDDVISGTSGADVIVGLRGNDIINGLGGDDVICGGLGLDRINGDEGSDRLLGGNENDAIDGGDGNDFLWGGTGWDALTGGLGNDILRGGIGNDRLAGGDGNDTLFGQDGTDKLDGGAGSNLLVQD